MTAPRRRSRAGWSWLALAIIASIALLWWRRGAERGGVRTAEAPANTRAHAPAPQPSVDAPRAPPAAPVPARPAPPSTTPASPAPPPTAWPRRPDPESNCHGIGAYGACEGSVAKACVANAVYSVDCAARHMRCVLTDEGAQCKRSDPATDCTGTEPAACEGDALRTCVDGSFQHVDCKKRGGACRAAPEGAHCASAAAARAGEGAVLNVPAAAVETCDGRDDDSDGRVDEMDVCSTVPLVAFVPDGYVSGDLEARMQDELAIVNRVYAPTTFQWAQRARAPATYARFDPKYLSQAAATLARSAMPSFYIPVMYVADLAMDPPKGGISTLPNARCGGVRLVDHPVPADGIIVLPESRQPETLAHELGHYLGLCHTHQDVAPLALADDQRAECKRTGDAMCETPFDPGPSRCVRDEVCEVLCPSDAAEPNPTNIMSYYIGCREALAPDQLAEARRNLSLRRAWFACLDPDKCECTPGLTACPIEMSCQPGASADASWSCRLDGAAQPGSQCTSAEDCANGSFCLASKDDSGSGRCVQPCTPDDDCECVDVGLPARICRRDLPE
jgi:hypothetical protein